MTNNKTSDNIEKQCYRCGYLDRFYVKDLKQYNKVKYGWCVNKRNVVGIHDCCDNYKGQYKTKKSNFYLLSALSDILTDLSEIRNILQDDRDNDK